MGGFGHRGRPICDSQETCRASAPDVGTMEAWRAEPPVLFRTTSSILMGDHIAANVASPGRFSAPRTEMGLQSGPDVTSRRLVVRLRRAPPAPLQYGC